MHPRRQEPLRYARDFADWLHARLMSGDTDAMLAYRDIAPGAERAHPSEEHLLPLLVAWGAAGEDAKPQRVVEGFLAGALAIDAYLFHPAH